MSIEKIPRKKLSEPIEDNIRQDIIRGKKSPFVCEGWYRDSGDRQGQS